ncbi:MAG: hypothetical protein ACXWLR_13645 [Myxococcales bacterium]
MRRRVERAFLLALVAACAVWMLRKPLRAARWHARGALELLWLPAAGPAAHVAPPLHIAHAGGAFAGLRYTNAEEALEENYARGARWFEMDFLDDAEGRWWAIHEWRDPREERLRLLTLERTLSWFAAHGDARLISDTKGDNQTLLRLLGSAPEELRARIHPQIYRIGESALARSRGLAAPIFTTYRSAYPWSVVGRFAARWPLLAVAVTREQAGEACAALCGRVPLLTHTVNDPVDAANLLRAGIAGIYTDELLP